MPTYEVKFPIYRGMAVYNVEANNEEEAIELAMDGNFKSECIEDLEVDYDKNLADCKLLMDFDQ